MFDLKIKSTLLAKFWSFLSFNLTYNLARNKAFKLKK